MIPSHIFREYDIRGLHETELTDEVAFAVGSAFGTRIRREGGRLVALGQDVRPSSQRLASGVERGLLRSGCSVERLGVVPTPAVYFAVSQLGPEAGLQVTGSHNPPEFNGFKMTRRTQPVFGAEIQAMREMIARGDLDEAPGGAAVDRPVLDRYQDMLVERCRPKRGLRVVMDCGNGCAGVRSL